MKHTLTLLIALVFTGFTAFSQVCEQMKHLQNEATYSYKSFDAKGKLTSTSQNSVVRVNNEGDKVEAIVSNETLDHKGKSVSSGEVTIICQNNVIYLDLRSMINPQNMKGMENMEVKIEENQLELPSNLIVGDKLKDGVLKMTISNEGQQIAVIEMKIHNRTVEGQEEITTDAGSFDTWKIKYEMEMVTTTIIPLRIISSGIDWYSLEYGTIKTETYNRKEKLTGYSELSEANFISAK
ncbi:MAG: hypothetical protein H0X62_15745 [Bacteroidetes bacterium]|nr:hypothetical protein [Bacteroidota bacterium]